MATPGIAIAARLQAAAMRVFTTADVRVLTRQRAPAATHALQRLAAAGIAVRLKRGVWALKMAPGLSVVEGVPHLAAPWPAYVSLHSALSRAGMISEIPHVTYAVTAGPPRRVRTPLGTVDFHHLPPSMLFGFTMERDGEARFPVADPEKAFLDTLYLSLIPRSSIRMPPRREGRWPLDRERLSRYARRFDYSPLIHRLQEMNLGPLGRR